jgi:ribonucleoside-diphosphate reductase alpha chain
MLIPGGGGTGSAGGIAQRSPGLTVGANALKSELSPASAPAEEKVGEAEMSKLAFAAPSVADRRAEAKMKGYVGEACPECANFTLVRNGTCLKCDTCGSTTGCS